MPGIGLPSYPRQEMMAVAQPWRVWMGHGWRSGYFRR
jgi:hypothetical protein